MSAEPFKIEVADAAVEDFRARLAHTRWPDALDGVGWDYGVDDGYLRGLVERWRAFDWRGRAAELNRLPHYRAPVDGETIHFIRVPGKGPRPVPLMLTHGWPSSFIEYVGLIGPLSDPAAHGGDPADAFDVIVPSLPGYGYSSRPTRPGMNPRRIADLWVKLMAGLGYPRFGSHGCDWGSYVTAVIGLDHPDRAIGVHMGSVSLGVQKPRKERPDAGGADVGKARRAWRQRESAYAAIQGSKPQTLAYGLTDSPVGLAAWIGEKWNAWTDRDLPREDVLGDALLTNLSVYWDSGTINSSCRLYYENQREPVVLVEGQKVAAPSGFFIETPPGVRRRPDFKEGSGYLSGLRATAEEAFNVQHWFEAPRGGHFPALETPDLLVDELRAFFRPLR